MPPHAPLRALARDRAGGTSIAFPSWIIVPEAGRAYTAGTIVKRHRLHILVAFVMWLVFGWYWWLVVQRPLNPHTRVALLVVASIVAVAAVATLAWIGHNRRIARVRNRRRRRPEAPDAPPHDYLGRTLIVHDAETLRHAPYVEVHVVDVEQPGRRTQHKVFHVPSRLPESAA